MEISIRGLNVEVPDTLRLIVEEKIAKLGRFLEGMEKAEVHFLEEKNPRIAEKEVCEVTMHGHGHIVRARAAAADTMAALDRVVDKLEHRMEKLKGKLLGRSHPRRHGSVDLLPERASRTSEDESEESDDDGTLKIVKTKQFAIKPMTPEEAALQMDLLGHDFYFFTNAETERAAVVYRRGDGHIGLIDATN